MAPALLLALLAAAPADTIHLQRGARGLAVAPDGAVALAAHGDLWVLPAGGGAPIRVTTDDAWDRDPAWAADGSLVFASDRGGAVDLWRVRPLAGAPREALTATPEPEGEPAPLPDGSLVFVRGQGATADLWLRDPAGAERRLTDAMGAERSPAPSPDGRRVAYVEEREGRRRLRVRPVGEGEDRVLYPQLAAELPAWSPDGGRIAFATRAGRPGVWIAAVDGSYANLVSAHAAEPAWKQTDLLLLAELPREDAGYNGDPDRLGDRAVGESFPEWGSLWRLRPSAVPDEHRTAVELRLAVPRAEHHARVFDQVWGGLERQFGGDAALLAEFRRGRERWRAAVLGAGDEAALRRVVLRMTRERPPLRREAVGRAGVSSAHPLATAAGVEMLRRGGNVVDAAVAVSFALGVVEPDASGIGGYGTMLLHLPGMQRPKAIEFLTRVPQAATLENGALAEDRTPAHGPAVVNVPGTVAGMWHAHQKYGSGRLSWAELLQPAIELAEGGWVLDEAFATTLAVERERYEQHPSSKALFFRDGNPLAAGDTLRNPDLAWTLRQIAGGGADAFYRGEVGRRMVADLHGRGNAMQLHDLARYHAVEREPVVTTYRGATVYSSPPATSGGALLAAKLNLLEQHAPPRDYTADAAALHAMIEAWKLMPTTRGRIADPGLWPVELEPFTSKDTARARWRCFDPQRASAPLDEAGACAPAQRQSAQWGADDVLGCAASHRPSRGGGCRMTGTTAFAVADADGAMVSVTQTLGTWGGNFYVSPGLGFLYNDKLRSYADDASAYNARIPFARNVTSISPTLLFRGTGERQRPWMALGAAGNAWINSAVYQMIAGVVDQGLGPQAALELPRFLVGGERRPDGERATVVQMESGFDPEVLERLRSLGHELHLISRPGELRMGYGAAVMVDGGAVRAGADPRRSGAAGAVRK